MSSSEDYTTGYKYAQLAHLQDENKYLRDLVLKLTDALSAPILTEHLGVREVIQHPPSYPGAEGYGKERDRSSSEASTS